MPYLAPLLALVVAATLTWRFRDPASGLHILDHPGERSLHTRAVPRSGGVAVLAGLAAGWIALAWAHAGGTILVTIGLWVVPVAVISFVDDRREVPPLGRILVHLACGAGLVLTVGAPEGFGTLPDLLAACLLVVGVAWIVNLYNFMDGMDGFAGGMAVIGFATFATLGGLAGSEDFAAGCWVACAAAAGFLPFNFPPASIFLGDTGASSLGFVFAGLGLWAWVAELFPPWIALLVLSPFVVDASVTLARRLLRGEAVWRAHRSHYYQRLVLMGWGHRRTVLAEYALMLACAASALAVWRAPVPVQLATVLVWGLLYVGLHFAVVRLERRRAEGAR